MEKQRIKFPCKVKCVKVEGNQGIHIGGIYTALGYSSTGKCFRIEKTDRNEDAVLYCYKFEVLQNKGFSGFLESKYDVKEAKWPVTSLK